MRRFLTALAIITVSVQTFAASTQMPTADAQGVEVAGSTKAEVRSLAEDMCRAIGLDVDSVRIYKRTVNARSEFYMKDSEGYITKQSWGNARASVTTVAYVIAELTCK